MGIGSWELGFRGRRGWGECSASLWGAVGLAFEVVGACLKNKGRNLRFLPWLWVLIVFEFVSQHLLLFFELSGSSTAAFAFIISPLAARRFPTFESHTFS